MKLQGTQNLDCSAERAWELLMDPEIIAACIPGCESLTRNADDQFSAVVTMKIGPVKARFNGDVQLTDLHPPHSCRIKGKGNGGLAGFAEGGATISLTEEDGTTRLDYDADAQVGGKLAQLGSRLIDSTAKKLAIEFFQKLEVEISQRAG
jgi:YD repeat-containing protein